MKFNVSNVSSAKCFKLTCFPRERGIRGRESLWEKRGREKWQFN